LDGLVAAQREELVLEAEAGTLSGGAITTTEHPGYTGTGFVRTLSREGAAFAVDVAGVAPGTTYEVSFRYANGMVVAPLDRQLSLTVDGVSSGPVPFPNLGQDAERWRRWGFSEPVRVTVGEGTTRVGLRYDRGDTGNVNVDHVRLVPDRGVVVGSSGGVVGTTADVRVEVQPRCLAGKAYVALRALNGEDVPVGLTLDLATAFGERTVSEVAPGASGYQSFATRARAVEATTAVVTAHGELGGEPVDARVAVDVPAVDCG
jgi:hypothetical protein